MTEQIEIVHDGTGGRAHIPRTALAAHVRRGWRPADPHQVVEAAGTVADVLAEVGDDPVKAAAALDLEHAGRQRTTLIGALEDIATAPPDQSVTADDYDTEE
jgi:hypothetical protein